MNKTICIAVLVVVMLSCLQIAAVAQVKGGMRVLVDTHQEVNRFQMAYVPVTYQFGKPNDLGLDVVSTGPEAFPFEHHCISRMKAPVVPVEAPIRKVETNPLGDALMTAGVYGALMGGTLMDIGKMLGGEFKP